MAHLVIKLMGCFQVIMEEQSVSKNISDKGRALLAFLVLENDRPHRREALAELFWPYQTSINELGNLRQTLHQLRQVIDTQRGYKPYFLITPHDVQFNCKSDYWVDVAEFTRLLGIVDIHHKENLILCEDCIRHLQDAIDMYKGDLLAGFSLSECTHFDWWLLARIEEYHRLALLVLDRLVTHFNLVGNYSAACQYAQSAIELEPWRECSHRMKMLALALNGNPGAAIRQYETCCKILAIEMGIEPAKKTKDLLEQIRLGSVRSLRNLEDD